MNIRHRESVFYEYLFRKGERLTAATYLLTGFFSDKEPLKFRLREKTLELHAALHGLYQTHSPQASADLSHIVLFVSDIRALYIVAKTARLMSESNAGVMITELDDLERRLTERADATLFASYVLPKEFFETPLEESNQDKGTDRLHSLESFSQPRRVLEELELGTEDKTQKSGQTDTPKKSREVANAASANKGQNNKRQNSATSDKIKRRQAILDIVRDNGEVSVKDIADVISDCSEKTLQRELQALVRSGALRKEGDRRWSRYIYTGNGQASR